MARASYRGRFWPEKEQNYLPLQSAGASILGQARDKVVKRQIGDYLPQLHALLKRADSGRVMGCL